MSKVHVAIYLTFTQIKMKDLKTGAFQMAYRLDRAM